MASKNKPAKRASGGKRDGERRRALKAAQFEAAKAWAEGWQKRYAALGPFPLGDVPAAHTWQSNLLGLMIEASMQDPALAPSMQREQAARFMNVKSKVDPAADMADELRAVKQALDALQSSRANGSAHPPAGAAGSPSPPTIF